MAEKKNKSRRVWPWGLLATGLAGTAVMVLRGCWHTKMSWPIRIQEHSYQVCTGCGIKRLFDEKNFLAYGPYSYDLNRLIQWEKNKRAAAAPAEMPAPASAKDTADKPAAEHRPAS